MIQLQDVTKVHHRGTSEVHALRGVSCEFPEGSLTFILGPSGSGKSTLLYLIGALEEPTGGHIQIDGRELNSLTDSERTTYRRETVGFVFQNFNLLSNLTAVENVLVPFLPSGVSNEQVDQAGELLKRVGLDGRLNHRPHQLSGGEQQRIAIARALLKSPRIVLADEPTGELDSKTGAEIFDCLRELHDSHGSTLIIVTHDERYIRETDRVLRIRDGRTDKLQHVAPPSES